MARDGDRTIGSDGEEGQAALLMLGMLAVLLAGVLVLFGFGQALGAKGHTQRAADLAAVSAAQIMRDLYPRLFEPPFLERDVPNPRHLEQEAYLELARAAAVRGARRNGVRLDAAEVSFPTAGFAPTRVTVRVRGEARVRVSEGRRNRIPVRATATAELSPAAGSGMPGTASGGGYDGPLAYRQGKPMRPDVALAFDRMAAAARREAGIFLSVTSGFRSDAEQARLFAAIPTRNGSRRPAQPAPIRAPSSISGPRAAYGWLAANASGFGFMQRYSWELAELRTASIHAIGGFGSVAVGQLVEQRLGDLGPERRLDRRSPRRRRPTPLGQLRGSGCGGSRKRARTVSISARLTSSTLRWPAVLPGDRVAQAEREVEQPVMRDGLGDASQRVLGGAQPDLGVGQRLALALDESAAPGRPWHRRRRPRRPVHLALDARRAARPGRRGRARPRSTSDGRRPRSSAWRSSICSIQRSKSGSSVVQALHHGGVDGLGVDRLGVAGAVRVAVAAALVLARSAAVALRR